MIPARYPGAAAVKRAKSYVGKAAFSGMCQAFTVTMFGTGGVGDYDRDGDADAVDGWKKAKEKVHASAIRDYSRIPAGVALYWSGGRRGYGHAAVSIGGGKMVTTDAANGRVGVATIKGWWAASHTFLGYVTVEGNGHTLNPAVKDTPPVYRVIARSGLNVRKGPGLHYARLRTLKAGTVIHATGRSRTVLGRRWLQGNKGGWFASGGVERIN